ncbi:MAG: hypothetical protein KAI40_03330 [Desulfobacterales bacterium]|nr:hypothetical protein [Desulfobacterales bacterium]
METNKSGLLDGKKEISDFLNGAGDYRLKKYLEAGMPVLIEDGRWLAHKQNIEDFFKYYTKVKVDELPLLNEKD